ncbi:MAG: protein kinase [Bacteroidales bacterium]|nr:protein kinase [Bacteroidales bacterium]
MDNSSTRRENPDKFFLVSDSTDTHHPVPPLGESDSAPLPPGSIIGNYRLDERLGAGGMGEVYRGVHTRLGGTVAIKLIHANRLRSPTAARRFLREVQASAQLDHPHIVRAVDAGEEDGRYFLVLEFIDGDDLDSRVAHAGPLSIAEVFRAGRELGLALQYLHETGLVHRDVKPANLVWVRRTGAVKLLDLGLTRFQNSDDDDKEHNSTTQAGTVLGTPDFIAPEQAINPHRADIRSDIYSAGCTLYYLLTGSVPFPGGTTVEKLIRQHQDEIPDVRQRRPDVPQALADVLRRAMAKSPEDRFSSPADFVRALTFAESLPADAPAATPPLADPGIPSDFQRFLDADTQVVPTIPQRATARDRTSLWAIPAAVGVAVLAVIFAVNSRRPAVPLPPPPVMTAAPPVEDAQRLGLHQKLAAARGTPEAVAIAAELRKTASPFDAFATHTLGVPAVVIGSPARRHTQSATAIATNGTRVVTAGDDRVVRIWEWDGLRPVATLMGHQAPLSDVSLSADGRRIAAASGIGSLLRSDDRLGMGSPPETVTERALQVWDATTGAVLFHLDQQQGSVTASHLLRDGKQVLVGQNGCVTRWDIGTQAIVQKYTVPDARFGWVHCLAVSHDEKYLLAGSPGVSRFHLWELRSGRYIRGFGGFFSSIQRIQPSPDNTSIATIGTDVTVRIWDAKTGEVLQQITLPQRLPTAIAWESPEQLVVGWNDGSICAYRAQTGAHRWQLNGHFGAVTGIACHDSTMVSCGEDGSVRQWDIVRGVEVEPPPLQAPVGRLVFVDRDRQLRAFPRHGRPVTFDLPAGTSRAPGWAVAEWTLTGVTAGGETALGTNPRGRLARWDVGSQEPQMIASLERRIGKVRAFSANGGRVLFSPKPTGPVRWVDLTTGVLLEEYDVPGPITQLAVSPDEQFALIATMRPNQLTLRSLRTGATVQEWDVSEYRRVGPVAFAPDAASFVLALDNAIYRFPLHREERTRIGTVTCDPACLAISADNLQVALGALDGEFTIFSPNGEGMSAKASWPIQTLTFSQDGKALATGFANGMIAVYRTPPIR